MSRIRIVLAAQLRVLGTGTALPTFYANATGSVTEFRCYTTQP